MKPGSGTRSTAEELSDELGFFPSTLTLGSNGAIRESVQVSLGITLISRDAVAREIEQGDVEEWEAGLRRERSWHVVGRAGEDLPPTAALFVGHVTAPGAASAASGPDAFRPAGRGESGHQGAA